MHLSIRASHAHSPFYACHPRPEFGETCRCSSPQSEAGKAAREQLIGELSNKFPTSASFDDGDESQSGSDSGEEECVDLAEAVAALGGEGPLAVERGATDDRSEDSLLGGKRVAGRKKTHSS